MNRNRLDEFEYPQLDLEDRFYNIESEDEHEIEKDEGEEE